jgi:transposase
LGHLSEALDKIRKQEYARLSGKDRKYIKGQKYTLLAHPQNLSGDARKNLKRLLAANKRLNTAYLLKESFGQLWDYRSEAWARKFFENWRASLKWQRLKPFEKFAEMIGTTLGWNCSVLPARKQGCTGLRRGTEQQDPGHPASRLRAA